MSLFEGLGGGAFAAAVNHPAGHAAKYLRVADADRDLHPDAILGTWLDAEAVRILRGLADGTLAPYVPYGFGYQTSGLAVGDLDGDFMPDLVLNPLDPAQLFVARHQLLPWGPGARDGEASPGPALPARL